MRINKAEESGHPTMIEDTPLDKKEPELKTGTVITDLYGKPDELKEEDFIVGDTKWKVKYHSLVWERYNQICTQASNDTAKNPSEYIRKKQELLIREMIVEVAGVKVDATFWNNLDWKVGEALRMQIFGESGEVNVSEEFLKNLTESLPELIKTMKDIESQ